MAPAEARIDRPLSGFERQFWAWGRIGGMNAALVARLRGDLDPPALEAALRAVQRRHPLLGARIIPRGGPRWAAGAPEVPLGVLPRDDDTHWVRAAEARLDAFFPDEGCLWEARLLQGRGVHDLVLVFHHAVADARSAVQVLQDLVAALRGEPLSPVPDPGPHEALLPPGTRAPPRALGLARFLLLLATRRPVRLPWDGDAPPMRRRTRIQAFEFDPGATARLIARAKAERASVNGALAAALLPAVAHEARPGGASTVGWASQVDFRPMLRGLPPDGVGCYAFGLPFFHRAGPGVGFWDLAREATIAVNAAVARKAPLAAVAGLARAPRRLAGASERLQRLGRLSPLAAGVSNVGRIAEVPPARGVVVEQVRLLTSLGVAGAGVSVMASTYQGRMEVLYFHPAPVVADARAGRIAEAADAAIRAALG